MEDEWLEVAGKISSLGEHLHEIVMSLQAGTLLLKPQLGSKFHKQSKQAKRHEWFGMGLRQGPHYIVQTGLDFCIFRPPIPISEYWK